MLVRIVHFLRKSVLIVIGDPLIVAVSGNLDRGISVVVRQRTIFRDRVLNLAEFQVSWRIVAHARWAESQARTSRIITRSAFQCVTSAIVRKS